MTNLWVCYMQGKGSAALRRRLLRAIIGSGLQITPDALDYLKELAPSAETIRNLLIAMGRSTTSNLITVPVLKFWMKRIESVGASSSALVIAELAFKTHNGRQEKKIIEVDTKTLDFEGMNIASIDLSLLEPCRLLESINLRDNRLETLDISPLSDCSELRNLLLDGNRLKSIDLSPLQFCEHLEVLNLAKNYITNVDLTPLKVCTGLKRLDLEHNLLEIVDFTPLNGLTHLSDIGLDGNPLVEVTQLPTGSRLLTLPYTTGSGGKRVICLSQDIEVLRLSRAKEHGHQEGCIELQLDDQEYVVHFDFSAFSNCTSLQIVDIDGVGVREVDLDPFRNCTQLQELHIRGPFQGEGIYLPKHVTDIPPGPGELIQQLDLSPLKNCETLRVLDLSDLGIDSVDLSPLKHLKNLQELRIHNLFIDRENGSIDLSPLQQCKNLKEIRLSRLGLADIDLSFFKNYRLLKELNLSANGFTSIDLAPLSELEGLRRLDVSCNAFHSIDLAPLAGAHVEYDYPMILHQESDAPSIRTMLSEKEHSKLEAHTDVGSSSRREHQYRFYDLPLKLKSIDSVRAYYSRLKEAGEDSWKFKHLVQCVPPILGFPTIGLLDAAPIRFLISVLKLSQRSDSAEKIQRLYTKSFCAQIDRGGTTIGIDLDADPPGEIMVRAKRILELREAEMHGLTLSVTDGRVDYLPLWSTAYGNRVLLSLGKGLTDSLGGLSQIEMAMEDLGYPIGVNQEASVERSNLSRAMSSYIRVMCSLPEKSKSESEWREEEVSKDILNLPCFPHLGGSD
ncbi:hypothetical protein EU538_11760 [Candidatus Thorarchaeota archaeon]|nr:MAG: hypothetical protein EU538_11760 [Candidatus Thorarchaeota archaeon]